MAADLYELQTAGPLPLGRWMVQCCKVSDEVILTGTVAMPIHFEFFPSLKLFTPFHRSLVLIWPR